MGELSTVAAAERVSEARPSPLAPVTNHCPSCGYAWTVAPDVVAPDPARAAALGELWARVLERCAGEVTDFIMHVWLAPLELRWLGTAPDDQRAQLAVIGAPGHVRGWVRERYADLLRHALSAELGGTVLIQLVAGGQQPGADRAEPERRQPSQPAGPEGGLRPGPKPETGAQASIKRRRSDVPAPNERNQDNA